jgi:hypothetical protein
MSRRRGRPPECKYTYKKADSYFKINDGDIDLDEIVIKLPSPPPYYLIDGYNKHPDDQYFRRLEIPDRLKSIERKARDKMRDNERRNKNFIVTGDKLITAFWDIFEEERKSGYDEVAEFIKEIHWHRKHGYWFFNDGKPTYITGDYFDYLNFWTFMDEKANDGGFPEYRDVDRRRYLFRHYTQHTTEKVILDEEGNAVVTDMGLTLGFGTAEPKHRRCGITGQSIHKGMKTVMNGRGRYFTIVSMEGDNAEAHYKKKLIPAFESYPLWITPTYSGSTGKSVVFDTGRNIGSDRVLKSIMDYTDSAGERKNDGDKLHCALFDEEGKTREADILERWSVNKQAMSLGGGAIIIGFSIHPTTVEEMDIGGMEYMKLCNQSKFYERGENGQTISGLFEMFIPAWDGLEGFVDRFGMSVIDKPTQRQMELKPNSMFALYGEGSRHNLQKQLDELLAIDTPEAKETYRSRKRKYPMRYTDCWLGSSGDVGFDIEIIDSRIAELRRNSRVRTGVLKWTNGFGSDVEFEDDVDGVFELSMILKPEEANQKMKVDDYDPVRGEYVQHWAPKFPYRFTASADPFKAGTSNDAKKMGTHSRQSDGGIAVLWERDDRIDQSDNMRDWTSHRFVFSYRYRPPSLEDYCEDVLKVCIYFGAMIYPERNVGDLDIWFTKAGYGGYLLYDIDPISGKRAEKAGFASYEKAKGNLFVATKDYVRFRGHKEEHVSYLLEIKGIQGMEQMNKYDRFTAHGGCLLGSKQNYYNMQREKSNKPSAGQIEKIVNFFNKM